MKAILFMLAVLALVLTGAQLARYHQACVARCTTPACVDACDAAAGF